MKSFLRDLFYGVSNAHADLGRVSLAVGLLSVIVFQGWALLKGQPFDASTFGVGVATVLGAGGAGIFLKDKARASSLGSEGGTNGDG